MTPDYTSDEMMTVAAARQLRDGTACFVGIGLPSTAANLARATHAPNLVLIYVSGCLGCTSPSRQPPHFIAIPFEAEVVLAQGQRGAGTV